VEAWAVLEEWAAEEVCKEVTVECQEEWATKEVCQAAEECMEECIEPKLNLNL